MSALASDRPSRAELLRRAASGLRDSPGVLMTGPVGIGKSYLLAELARGGAADFGRVLRCAPVADEIPLPFVGLIDLLEPVPDDVIARLPDAQRRALNAALQRGGEPADEDAGGGRVNLAVLALLRMLGAESPILLAIDDLQWLDDPTAQALRFAVRRISGERLRMAATELVPQGRATTRLGLCPPGTVELALPPMEPGELAAVLSGQAGAEVSERSVREICRLAHGNPLYALEILRALPVGEQPSQVRPASRRSQNTDPLRGLAVPARLRSLLLERLGELPQEAREVLVLASAAVRPDITLLATALADSSVDTAIAHLESAERAGIVRIAPEGHIHFDHPLLRDAVYSSATARSRRDAHRRLAAVVAEPVERARHLALAHPAQDEAVASTLAEAAVIALHRGAPAAAAELAGLAVARTPADTKGERTRRSLAHAGYATNAGLWDQARHAAETVLAEESDVEARAQARLILLDCAGQALEGARTLIVEGLAEAAGSPGLEARFRVWAATRDLLAGRVDQAAVETRRAAELARSAGDVGAQIKALTDLAYLQRMGGDQEADATLARALKIARGHGAVDPMLCETLITEAVFHLHANRLAEAEAALTAVLNRFGEQVSVEDALRAHITLVDVRIRSGDCAGALLAARRAVDLDQDLDSSQGPAAYAAAAAESFGGSLDQAREWARRGARNAQEAGDRFWYLWNLCVTGRVHLFSDEPAAAARVLREVRALEHAMGIVDPGIGRWHPDLAEALVGEGSLEEARQFIEEVSIAARRLGRLAVLGSLERAEALRRLALGDPGAAAALLETSVTRLRREGVPLELARSLSALADVERRRRRRTAAQRAAKESFDLCRAAGATALLDRIGNGAPSGPARAPGAARNADRRPGAVQAAQPIVLTPSQQRIAKLAADGATNREIAAACYLSVKAVEAALSQMYRKVGVRSRVELAKALETGRAVGPDPETAPKADSD